jgi:ankyrin repeat protein
LDETYERTLLDIDEEKWEFAHRLFQCVTVASRPLRVEELGEFLAFNFDAEGRPIFEEDWRPEDAASAVLSTCSSMISVIEAGERRVVQFSHFSVKEFLTSTRIERGQLSRFYVPLEPSHTIVAQACLFILLLFDNHVTEENIKEFPLAHYAAKHWVDHAMFGNVSAHIEHDMKQLFNPDKHHVAVWTRIYDKMDFNLWVGRTSDSDEGEDVSFTLASPEAGPSPLYYSALCGFHEIAEWLVTTCSQDVNAQGGYYVTALCAASAIGSLQIVQLLLEHGADPNVGDSFGITPLDRATLRGYLKMSQLLIEYGADVNAKDSVGQTPLHLASSAGHMEIAKLLLESNANPNPEWSSTWPSRPPPLYEALAWGHPQVVQLLLHHSANPHTQGLDGRTLLHVASQNGHLNAVEQLLELGANVHVRDHCGLTPFQVISQIPKDVSVFFRPDVNLQEDKDTIRELLLKYGSSRD